MPRGGGHQKEFYNQLGGNLLYILFFLMKIQGHNLVKKQIIWFEGFCDQPEGYL